MNIKSAQSIADRLFKTFKDAVSQCSYKSFDNQSADYDPRSENLSDDSTIFDIDVILLSFSFTKSQSDFKEVENENVLARDRKGIVKYLDFPVDLVPKIDDVIIDTVDSIEYFVVGANKVPMKSIYLLHLRPKEDL